MDKERISLLVSSRCGQAFLSGTERRTLVGRNTGTYVAAPASSQPQTIVNSCGERLEAFQTHGHFPLLAHPIPAKSLSKDLRTSLKARSMASVIMARKVENFE